MGDGETHFTLCNLTTGWESKAFGPGQPPIFTRDMDGVAASTGLTWFWTPYRWKPAVFFHPNPVVQFGVWFTGNMKFQATDNTTVHIGGGDVYFGDDVGSKGHHSENVGYGPALSAMIQFKGTKGSGPCWPSKV